MKAIPIEWIRNYKKYICQFSKEYGTDITDAIREELETMIDVWERESMKAILVTDMPTSCDECKFESEMLNCGKPMCVATPHRRERIEDDSTKPSWCPLKPMPEKKVPDGRETDQIYGCYVGWNACLEEIENG